ncbi:MAG TPA: DNA polymerase III subunit gamma/tau, partial [Planctomycetes bacterium]|nr:DNA polymerase III subunit gamma/tau [Planctomycetota bacterium]
MTYQVLARRFRPKTFEEVVGQEGVTGTLVQGLKSGRIAHAWLFAGPRGVGKTTTARILARALNCEKGPTPQPCGVCPVCKDFLAGRDPDVEEIDGASNRRIENVRELRERVSYMPLRGSYKVFIIDEVHMLTREAFNALLKTLEEPPPHVVFILATTEPHKVPETIRSRCQVLTFHRIGPKEIAARLGQICEAEKKKIPAEVLSEIAASVRGGMRDAESILERVLTLASGMKGEFG